MTMLAATQTAESPRDPGRRQCGPRIALLIDNPFRDLPGLVLVARALCAKGATCFLVPMNLREQELWPLMPDLVLLNHFRSIYDNFVQRLDVAGIRVAILDTEGTIYSPNAGSAATGAGGAKADDLDEYALAMSRRADLRGRVACCCAWTPRFAAHAVAKGWYRDDQLVVTGHPRMDLYAPAWRTFATRIAGYVDPFAHNLVMINGSFALANPAFQTAEQEVRMLTESFAYDRAYVEQWLEAQRLAMAGLTQLARDLAARFPAATFVFRPHPFERESTYRDLALDRPNLHLVKQGTVDGWLLRAKALVHWGSSTAIDACLAGIPALAAGWLPAFPPIPAVEAVSIRCADRDALATRVEAALHDRFADTDERRRCIADVVEQTFYRIDGCAHERVACALFRAALGAKPSRAVCRAHTAHPGGRSWRSRATRMAKRALGLPLHWSFRQGAPVVWSVDWDSSPKRFGLEDVARMLAAVDEPSVAARLIAAQDRRDYQFGYDCGRSLTMYPG